MAEKRSKNWLWPQIDDLDTAKQTSRLGVWAALFVALLTTTLVILSWFGKQVVSYVDTTAWLDGFLFAIIAWRIYKFSKIAPIAGLALYLFERIYLWANYGAGGNLVLAFFLMMMFINSARGTFAYHKFIQNSTTANDQDEKKV